ncbi:MAG: hypothetical protein FWH57_02635 [Oscillospiraceae bacterium]|nr:hypothetical protein [Oscillospiraceae bacterium]
MREILVIDTSILCVWLGVPGKESCGASDDIWDKARVNRVLDKEEKQGTKFVLPLAVIIETGNHIAQSQNSWECARALCDIVLKSIDSASPWIAFSQQDALWNPENLRRLANEWPKYAVSGLSFGDMTIKAIAELYAEARFKVRILTGDEGLKAFEPVAIEPIPRRYKV